MKKIFAVFILVALVGITSCKDSGTEPTAAPPPTDTVSYAREIQPILTARCGGCHGGSGGLFLTSYQQLKAGNSAHGPVVVAGNGDGSALVQKLRPSPPFGSRMPQGGSPLPDATVSLISKWITQGAKNN